MKLQVSSPIIINLKKRCQYNDDNMVQTLSVYYGIDWNWSGIAIIGIGIGIELPYGFCTGVGIELELISPELELELNCKNGIDPDSDC